MIIRNKYLYKCALIRISQIILLLCLLLGVILFIDWHDKLVDYRAKCVIDNNEIRMECINVNKEISKNRIYIDPKNIYKDLIDETIPPESPDMQYAEATAYCLKGTCADGTTVRDGICASKPEYIGKTIIVYDRKDMSIIGYFECTDTGSEPIRDGDTIDIWIEEYQDCKIFGRKQICYQVLDAVG